MTLLHKAREAFNRTAPHPADSAVRVASRPEDLAAIHLPEVRAVEWAREMPGDILEALRFADARVQAGDARWRFEARHNQAFSCEYGNLREIFMAALEGSGAQMYRRLSIPKEWCFEPPSRGHVESPHVDTLGFRQVTIFASDPALGTEWYPGVWPDLKLEAVEYAIKAAGPGARDVVRAATGRQTVTPGHVLLIKGTDTGAERAQMLAHNGQYPPPGVYRCGYILAATPGRG